MRTLACILDGLSDQPLQDIGGLTPLKKANTPAWDSLEHTTIIPPQGSGLEGSLEALVLGRDKAQVRAPAPLEALARGYRLQNKQVAYTFRLVSVGDEVIVDVNDRLMTDNEGQACCAALNAKFGVQGLHFIAVAGSRAVLITEHPELVESIHQNFDLNPISSIGAPWLGELPGTDKATLSLLYREMAKALSRLELNALRADLEEDPINGFLLYGGGRAPELSNAAWAGVELWTPRATYHGLAKALGLKSRYLSPEIQRFEHVPQVLNDIRENTADWNVLILDLPYLWQSTYKGDLLEKIKTMEWIDREFLSPIAKEIDLRLAVFSLSAVDIRSGSLHEGAVDLGLAGQWAETESPLTWSELWRQASTWSKELHTLVDR